MELMDKFDKRRNSLGKTAERYDNIDGEYKQSMHVWIRNDKGEFLIQKRSMTKKVFPGMWSITGGGVDAGEKTEDTVIRECKEELNIDANINDVELIMTIKRNYDFVDIYLLNQTFSIDDVTMQKEEVSDVKWVSIDELKDMINKGNFAESISFYFDMFMKILNQFGSNK